ncbi:hypothetical protein [Salmonella phage SE4]|uniref:hypothetical protein n=1 Tax=Salmonella phage SE4 TaxID=2575328 RepID=UPI0011D2C8D1|nr:hypothetical protein HWC20_gp10 [Salmonella phage SE4]QEG07736.1 hypothetical protein [Salmonella phage SE4]
MSRKDGKPYSLEDKYQHQLGILKAVMRSAGMDEKEPLCNILPRVRHMYQDNAKLRQAIDQAMLYGVSFLQVKAFTEPGQELVGISIEVVDKERVLITVMPDENSTSDS